MFVGDPADAERCDRFESLDRDLDFLIEPTLFTDPDLLERAGDTEPFLEGEFDFDRDLEPKMTFSYYLPENSLHFY